VAVEVGPALQVGVAERDHHRIGRGLVRNALPSGHGDGVAKLPSKVVFAHLGLPMALQHHMQGVGGVPIGTPNPTPCPAMHLDGDGGHANGLERNVGAPMRVVRGVSQFALRAGPAVAVGRLGRGLGDGLKPERVLFKKHGFQPARQRQVQAVKPKALRVTLVAVAVPTAAGGEHDVAGFHRVLVAIDHRIRATRIQDDAHGVGGVAVRAGLFAGQDGLIRTDQGVQGFHIMARTGVDHDGVAPLGQLGVDQAPRRQHGRVHLGIAPVTGLVLGAHLWGEQRARLLLPARHHVAVFERAAQCVEALKLVQGLHGVVPLRWGRFGGVSRRRWLCRCARP